MNQDYDWEEDFRRDQEDFPDYGAGQSSTLFDIMMFMVVLIAAMIGVAWIFS